ncbi:MAG: hypothetical protein QXU30_02240, partial [Sulfolobales archaeon]
RTLPYPAFARPRLLPPFWERRRTLSDPSLLPLIRGRPPSKKFSLYLTILKRLPHTQKSTKLLCKLSIGLTIVLLLFSLRKVY